MFSLVVFLENFDVKNNKFFSKLTNLIKQQKEIEIIFILSNENLELLSLIQKFQNENKNAIIKFSFFSKKITFNKVIKNISSLISNDYFMIISSQVEMSNDLLNKAAKILNSKNVNMLEIKPILRGLIDWKPKNRLSTDKINKAMSINENKDIIAFSFPFIFNKFFSTNLLAKIIKNHLKDNEKDNSNFLFSDIIYISYLYIDNYYYSSDLRIEYKLEEDQIQVFSEFLNSWNLINKSFNENKQYIYEINYAKWYYLNVMMCSYYSNKPSIKSLILNKKKALQEKWYKKLMEIREKDFNHFDLKNSYMISKKDKETNLLKDIHPISKWNRLLKELEN